MERVRHKGLFFGLFIGPLVSSEYMALLHYHSGRPDLSFMEYFPYSPLLALTYYMVMLPIALVVGVPGYFVLTRMGIFNGVAVSLYGAIVGFALAFVTTNNNIEAYAVMGSGGFFSALVAWLIIKNRSNTALKRDRANRAAP